MNNFKSETPVVQPISQHAERQYLHTSQAGVTVPFVQTLISALIFGVVVLIFALLANALDAWKWGLGAFALGLLGSWLLAYRHWFRLTTVEDFFGWDINGDGEIGEPETRVVRIQLQKVENNGHLNVSRSFDLPVSEGELVTLARGLMTGIPFAEREWAGSGKLLSSNRFRELRSDMIKRGLLEMVNDKDPRQGYQLTDAGLAVMQDYADMSE